jgi:hypothetical protein
MLPSLLLLATTVGTRQLLRGQRSEEICSFVFSSRAGAKGRV